MVHPLKSENRHWGAFRCYPALKCNVIVNRNCENVFMYDHDAIAPG
jgi:hypothetical protein